jgi:hypothetical protein
MPKHNDLTDQRFERLRALFILGKNVRGEYIWLCLCDCGSYTEARGAELRSGHVKSCGCLAKERALEKVELMAIANRLPPGEAYLRDTIRAYKTGAADRGLEWSLTDDDCRSLIYRPCFYCEAEPSATTSKKYRGSVANGIDRVDNTKGYTIANCVSCCRRCNYAKHINSLEDFAVWVRSVYMNLIRLGLINDTSILHT